MAERSDLTTYEEAKRCPKCGQPGVLEQNAPGPRPGSRVEVYLCDNELCPWLATGWTVQVNRDGSIPNRAKGQKDFPDLQMPEDRIKDYLDRLAAEDKGAH